MARTSSTVEKPSSRTSHPKTISFSNNTLVLVVAWRMEILLCLLLMMVGVLAHSASKGMAWNHPKIQTIKGDRVMF